MIGKVDLFGVTDGAQSVLLSSRFNLPEQGMAIDRCWGFLAALAHCAIVEANAGDIAMETSEGFGLKLTGNRPALIVMACKGVLV